MCNDQTISSKDDLGVLLRASAGGDVQAFRSLYELTSPRLYPIAFRIVRRHDLAEEILQDAYVTMWTKALQQSRGSRSVFPWMATIVRHRAIDCVRAVREEPRDPASQELEDPAGSAEDGAIEQASSEAIRRCIEALDESPRRAILLAYYEGLTHEEVALRLAAPLGTIKSWMRRALMRLKQCLER